MTVYYTAKDIEEMAARGIRQLEIGPGITLTDFARETARQLEIELVDARKERQAAGPAPGDRPAAPRSSSGSSRPSGGSKYSKPPGCMHGPLNTAVGQPSPATRSSSPSANGSGSTVNRLIDLMGKVMNRGE